MKNTQDTTLQNEFTRLISHEKTQGFKFIFWQKIIEISRLYYLEAFDILELKKAAKFELVEDTKGLNYNPFGLFITSLSKKAGFAVICTFTDKENNVFRYRTEVQANEIQTTVDYLLACI